MALKDQEWEEWINDMNIVLDYTARWLKLDIHEAILFVLSSRVDRLSWDRGAYEQRVNAIVHKSIYFYNQRTPASKTGFGMTNYGAGVDLG